MCGLIPDWQSYNHPLNSVSRPIQMGPVWMHASEVTQKYSIWFDDPLSSSYPACIAVKTVGLQSKSLAADYRHEIRRALMQKGVSISRRQSLFQIAEEMVPHASTLSVSKKSGKMRPAFPRFVTTSKRRVITRLVSDLNIYKGKREGNNDYRIPSL
jgi:hypothetical protein